MNLEPFTGPGSTPSRRRFWDKVAAAVNASQKVAGRSVTCDEHPGKGTIINVDDASGRGGGRRGGRGGGGDTGACCDEENNCTITTEGDCTGTFQGVGTVCDPNPCGATGACCIDGVCSILSEDDCAIGGVSGPGYYFGDGTDCDPDPCPDLGCCIGGSESGLCITSLSTDCIDPVAFVPNSFCNPENFGGGGGCCQNGDNVCSFFPWCCTPPDTCCGLESGSGTCCSPEQTCCATASACCNSGEICDSEEGCIPGFAFEQDTFFQNN